MGVIDSKLSPWMHEAGIVDCVHMFRLVDCCGVGSILGQLVGMAP